MPKPILTLLLALLLSLAACGGQPAPEGDEGGAVAGDPAAGEALFAQTLIGTQAGCTTCHSLEPGVTIIGPSLANIGTEAGARVSGESAEDYLRKSIVEPDATVVEGFPAGLMSKELSTELTEQQVNDLIAYLLTVR